MKSSLLRIIVLIPKFIGQNKVTSARVNLMYTVIDCKYNNLQWKHKQIKNKQILYSCRRTSTVLYYLYSTCTVHLADEHQRTTSPYQITTKPISKSSLNFHVYFIQIAVLNLNIIVLDLLCEKFGWTKIL